MTWQAYPGSGPRFTSLAVLSAFGLLACASPSTTGNNTGGTTGSGTGGTTGTGGTHTGGTTGSGGSVSTGGSTGTGGTHTGGSTGTGGSVSTGGSTGTGGTQTGGSTGTGTGGTGTGGSTGAGGAAGGSGSCTNTNMSVINEDASGYICNNKWGIQGAWYCYNDGTDSTNVCKGSNGKGMGAVPWNASSTAMCLSGTIGAKTSTSQEVYAGLGFKVNSGPPGSTTTPGTWNASNIVGFAITLAPGASGKGSGGAVLSLEYPTTNDFDTNTLDAPGVTVPGVAGTEVTYNALFSDSVLANDPMPKGPMPSGPTHPNAVDQANLTDVKLTVFPDFVSHSYDFCIKSVVPLTTAPNPVVATGSYGPAWTNETAQAVNGINGYAVQSAPFPIPPNGNPMTMQVNVMSDGVGFMYAAGSNFMAPNNGPGSFPAIISGWGPGEAGSQYYGPYKGGKTINGTNKLTSVTSNWSFTMGSTGDAVYDVWFASSATPPTPGVELMIWIGNTGKNALGSVGNPGTPVTGSDGVARTPYVGTNGTQQSVVSYWVASPGKTSVTNFNLLPYFQDAASHGYAGLSNNSFLLGIQAGFEVYSGTWTTTDYNINIQ